MRSRAEAARLLALVVGLSVAAGASTARAHPLVDRARQLVDEGDFEAAEEAFAAAVAAGDLTREELVSLLEARALLRHAQQDHAALEQTLLALASIEPTHRFGPRYPPDLAQRSVEVGRRLGGRLRIADERAPSAVGVRLVPRVEHDPAELVRELRIRVFDAATGQWRVATPPVEAAAGRRVLAFVEAVGPGGAVVATAGSPDAPLVVAGPGAEGVADGEGEGPLDGAAPPPRSGGVSDTVWVVLGVVAAVLVGVGIAAGIYFSENPYIEWQPTRPTPR